MSLATTSIRKAALLVRSLDTESAALLLAQLSPQEARAVRQAVRELGEIDPEEQAELARELRRSDTSPRQIDGGVELNLKLNNQPCSEVPAEPPISTPQALAEGSPFAWLEHGDLPTLANVLEREHLSTVAVVLSHLPSERAAALLAALPPGRRAAALERLADLGESDRASLEVIEKSLADWIARQKRQRQLRADRLQTIRQMLEWTPREARDAVLAELTRSDGRLATEINLPRRQHVEQRSRPLSPARWAGQVTHLRVPRNRVEPIVKEMRASDARNEGAMETPQPTAPPLPLFEFEQVAKLDCHELALLIRQTDSQTLVLALAGGSDEIMRHVTRQLPSDVARELTRRVNHLTQVRLSDVTKAQQRIAHTAAELKAAGRIARHNDN